MILRKFSLNFMMVGLVVVNWFFTAAKILFFLGSKLLFEPSKSGSLPHRNFTSKVFLYHYFRDQMLNRIMISISLN